jgi:general secretion pathway protein M
MTINLNIIRFAGHSWAAALTYLMLVVAPCLTTLICLVDAVERRLAYHSALEVLGRLKARTQDLSSDSSQAMNSWPAGSPFFEGQTATIASAALLQKITSIVTQVGGTIDSTEVESQGTPSKDGYLKVLATCELEQSALQPLLYQVETGMPFLFVDQLVIQSPTVPSERQRLRVLIGVSGLWSAER